jgi:hypothetical protein
VTEEAERAALEAEEARVAEEAERAALEAEDEARRHPGPEPGTHALINAALAEVAATSVLVEERTEVEAALEPEPDDDDDDDDDSEGPEIDTASLLRELSSLGLEDDAPQPAMRQSPIQHQTLDRKQKRRGLFGR